MPAERLDLDLLDRTLLSAADEVESVDCVILPECAVEDSEIADLEAMLDHHGVIYLQRSPGAFRRAGAVWEQLAAHRGQPGA